MADFDAIPCRPERRERKLLDGAYGPVIITIEPISKQSLGTYYHLRPEGDGVEVRYYGHKEDLAAADCLKFGINRRFDHFHDDDHGGSWVLASKAGLGKRGFIVVDYLVCSAAFAASLPGVTGLFPEAVKRISRRPQLRLIVDNTQRGMIYE